MYLSYIDGIRAFAVISVFLYHMNPHLLPGGFSGVDVFFVVSGYVVSLSLDKHKDIGLSRFLAIFYSRRIKRIVPALLFCLLITIFLAALFIPDSYLSSGHVNTAFYAFWGLSNIYLASGQSDYFGPTAEFNPFTHTWSLGVEEQFYFLFPYIFFLWTFRKKHNYRKLSVLIFSILLVSSLCICYWYSRTNKLYEYYLIFSRFWQLAAGILLYQFFKSKFEAYIRPGKKTLIFISWFALFLTFLGFILSDANNFPMPWALLPVLGTFLLLYSMNYLQKGFVLSILNNKYLSHIGKISYSLYLWHWPVIVLFKWTVGLDTFLKYALVILITYFMAYISYRFIERPIAKLKFVSNMPRYSVICSGLLIVAVSFYFGKLLFDTRDAYSFSIMKDGHEWYQSLYVPGGEELICSPAAHWDDFYGGHRVAISCPTETLEGDKLFVLGDSHASAYMALLNRYSAKTGNEIVIYTMPGCGDTINNTFENMGQGCKDFLASSLNDILSQADSGDTLFLASLKLPRFTEQWEHNNVELLKSTIKSVGSHYIRNKALTENVRVLQPLADRGVRIVFEAPKPIFKSPTFRCAKWFNKGNPVCADGLDVTKAELLEYRQPVMESLRHITSSCLMPQFMILLIFCVREILVVQLLTENHYSLTEIILVLTVIWCYLTVLKTL